MIRFAFTLLLLLIGLANAQAQTPNRENTVNLLSWGGGALLVQKPVQYSDSWRSENLQDEDASTGWASPEGEKGPFRFVFELAEKSEINRLVFDSASVDTADSAAKGVLVEMADAASGPWSPLANLTLKNAADKQVFSVPAKVGRYLRLTLLSNYGSPKYVELMGIAAYGNQLTQTPPPKVTGTYEGDFGPFRLMQEGASASGCYEHKEGLIENGGFDGRVLRFTWSESSGQNQPRNKGAALLIFPGDGSTFTGYWWNEGGKGAPAGDWKGKRINANVGSCPHWSPKGNGVAQQLKRDGRARLYGILFDTDSDRIKPESKPTLDSLIAAAKDNAAWKLRIEGHTDNTGGAAYNQTLSQKRAESVKAYLVTAGIAAARLESAGLGATQPVASNDTTAGRSQNRRVEVVLK